MKEKTAGRVALWGTVALYLAFMAPFSLTCADAPFGMLLFLLVGVPVTLVGVWVYFLVRKLVLRIGDKNSKMVWRVLSAAVLCAGAAAYLTLVVIPQAVFQFSPLRPAVQEQVENLPQIKAYFEEHRSELEQRAEERPQGEVPLGAAWGITKSENIAATALILDASQMRAASCAVFLVRYDSPHGITEPLRPDREHYETPLDDSWTACFAYYPPI